MHAILSTSVALSLPCLAVAQGVIRDRHASYEIVSLPATSTATGVTTNNFTAIPSTDQLFQLSWFYRVDNDPREYSFNTSNGQLQQIWRPNELTLIWGNVDGRNLTAVCRAQVYAVGTTAGVVVYTMTVANMSAAPVRLNLYSYADFDTCGTAGADAAAAMPTGNEIFIRDAACTGGCWYIAYGADAFEVATYNSIGGKLTNANVDNLANTGLPFGPADFTAAHQWRDRTLAPNQALTVRIALGHNEQPFCTGFARALPYGSGKAGTNGVATFGGALPFIGATVPLRVENGLGGAAPIALLGVTRLNVPVPNIGTLYVDPLITLGLPAFDAQRATLLPIAIPQDPTLCGLQLLMQVAFLDPGAAGGVAHTSGLEWALGGLIE